MVLLVATANAGKLAEFRLLLAGLRILSPPQAGIAGLAVAEVGQSFADNALLKARAFAAASGLVSLADDSGLEVDALGGRPGILSARYGGPGLDDAGRCRRLLAELSAVPEERRGARFRCCLAAVAPDGRTARAEGVCAGRILERPAGAGGFGYDPLFFSADGGRSMAQLTPEEKSAISHRGRALRAIRPLLLSTFPELGADE